jgi:hypothetical protein
MARVNPDRMEIIDLDNKTITNVDLQKRTYTVMTFAQMRQQMEEAMEKAKQQQSASGQQEPAAGQAQFSVKVRNTGTAKRVNGLNASESILTMQMTGTDAKTGQQGSFAITNDMWLTPDVPGYDQMRDFDKKLATEMGSLLPSGGLSSIMAMQPGMSQGMSDMTKEMSKLKGVPVEQIIRVGATANGQPLPAASEAPLPAASSGPAMPSAGSVAQQAATSAAASEIGGIGAYAGSGPAGAAEVSAAESARSAVESGLSHFGFGHHKKKKTPPPAATPPATTTATAANAQAAPPTSSSTVLLESRTDLGSFSTAPVDSSKFSVPAGFRQVQPKQMK